MDTGQMGYLENVLRLLTGHDLVFVEYGSDFLKQVNGFGADVNLDSGVIWILSKYLDQLQGQNHDVHCCRLFVKMYCLCKHLKCRRQNDGLTLCFDYRVGRYTFSWSFRGCIQQLTCEMAR